MYQCSCPDWRDHTDAERANLMARYGFDDGEGKEDRAEGVDDWYDVEEQVLEGGDDALWSSTPDQD